jgi:hypothetical protein
MPGKPKTASLTKNEEFPGARRAYCRIDQLGNWIGIEEDLHSAPRHGTTDGLLRAAKARSRDTLCGPNPSALLRSKIRPRPSPCPHPPKRLRDNPKAIFHSLFEQYARSVAHARQHEADLLRLAGRERFRIAFAADEARFILDIVGEVAQPREAEVEESDRGKEECNFGFNKPAKPQITRQSANPKDWVGDLSASSI